jgi:hypothetical protein
VRTSNVINRNLLIIFYSDWTQHCQCWPFTYRVNFTCRNENMEFEVSTGGGNVNCGLLDWDAVQSCGWQNNCWPFKQKKEKNDNGYFVLEGSRKYSKEKLMFDPSELACLLKVLWLRSAHVRVDKRKLCIHKPDV